MGILIPYVRTCFKAEANGKISNALILQLMPIKYYFNIENISK